MAKVLGTSVSELLLSLRFWAHRFSKCCRGNGSGHIGFGQVAVAKVLGI